MFTYALPCVIVNVFISLASQYSIHLLIELVVLGGSAGFLTVLLISCLSIPTHEKINGHRELTVTTVVTAPGPNDHG